MLSILHMLRHIMSAVFEFLKLRIGRRFVVIYITKSMKQFNCSTFCFKFSMRTDLVTIGKMPNENFIIKMINKIGNNLMNGCFNCRSVNTLLVQLLPLWTGRAVNFVTSGSGWPFFHSPRGKSGMSHGLNR